MLTWIHNAIGSYCEEVRRIFDRPIWQEAEWAIWLCGTALYLYMNVDNSDAFWPALVLFSLLSHLKKRIDMQSRLFNQSQQKQEETIAFMLERIGYLESELQKRPV
jgi:hypothetical protein